MTMKILSKLLSIGTLLSAIGFIGATSVQIFARFFLANAPSWTEEASRFFFIYAMSFAAGLALRDKYYVELDIFYRKFPKKLRKLTDLVVQLSTIVLFAIMGIFSVQYIILGSIETSPSMKIPMSFAFFSMTLMSLTLLIYGIAEFTKKNIHNKYK